MEPSRTWCCTIRRAIWSTTGKLLTTPDDPSVAIITGISRILQETGLKPSDLHSLVHGTTLITNTIIERTGATVGLLATEGFRDTIEIGRETRYDLYDLFLETPPTLVPRRRRLEIPERIDTNGKVLLRLDEDAVAAAVRQLVEQDKCEALAIAFMHSYRSPEHERGPARSCGGCIRGCRCRCRRTWRRRFASTSGRVRRAPTPMCSR